MLVLERKDGESLVFVVNGIEAVVTIRHTGSRRVKVLIEAPKEIKVSRGEIFDRIERLVK